MNTKNVGDISEAAAILTFLKKGVSVSKPIGENQRYDLIVDYDGLKRVQCKTAKLKQGVLGCSISRVGYKTRQKAIHLRYSRSEVDAFVVYSPETGKCYWITSDQLDTGTGELQFGIMLRIDPVAGPCDSKGIRWAKDYEL